MISPKIPLSTPRLMWYTSLALLPAIAVHAYFWHTALLITAALAIGTALLTEAFALYLRQRPIVPLTDGSAILTALLLALALPPYAPWWLVVLGASLAIGLGKHVYGGLGQNMFNPAMVAYVILLVSCPVPMTAWIDPTTLPAWTAVFNGMPLDGYTGATLLDLAKQGQTFTLSSQPSALAMNLAFACGGLALMALKVIDYRIPLSVLLGLLALSGLDYGLFDGLPPTDMLAIGATSLGAFFIATDPVTAPSTPRGRILYGLGIGLFIGLVRRFGLYPDGVAFAILLGNLFAPLIEKLTAQAPYGAST